jgi:hypothetical protein
LSGLLFIGFGCFVLYYGQKLAVGTSVRMGPGYVPHMLSYILLALGGLICVFALYSGGEVVERPKWRPITMVTLGILAFAFLLESFGMFPALVALVVIASLGGDEFKLIEVVGNVIVLTILCILVFKVGLSMNIAVLQGVW